MNSDSNSTNAQWEQDDDPVVDALLMEFISTNTQCRVTPPDLSEAILDKLGQEAQRSEIAPVDQSSSVSSLVRERSRSRFQKVIGTISIVAAIAASFLGLIWLATQGTSSSTAPKIVENSTDSNGALAGTKLSDGSAVSNDSLDRSIEENAVQLADSNLAERSGNSSRAPMKGIRLDTPEEKRLMAKTLDGESTQVGASPRREFQTRPLADVAKQIDSLTNEYWKRIGVTPTSAATDAEIAARTQKRIGIAVGGEIIRDQEKLTRHFARPRAAKRLAAQWLAVTTGVDAERINQENNAEIVDRLGESFSGKQPFAATFVSLIDGSDANSARWYELIGEGSGQRKQGPRRQLEGLAGKLAHLSMNADLRCTRCHDDMIGRSGTQEDHWSFVALVSQAMRREGGRLIVGEPTSKTPVFYELSDGRQRLAEPRVQGSLMSSAKTAEDFQTWTKSLPNSREFASSIVDSLWTMVHGRSLAPGAVDAFAPPQDETLDQIQGELASDLLASEFDVSRTLALIVASPMNQRSVPDSLLAENSLTASGNDRSNDLDKVAAFAAAVQTPKSSRGQRIELAMRRIGSEIRNDANTALLAQPMLRESKNTMSQSIPKGLSFSQRLSVDFPGDDADLPVSWLRSLDDFDQQVQHLVYLAGGRNVPANLEDAAKRLRDAGTEQSALSRLWWILRQ